MRDFQRDVRHAWAHVGIVIARARFVCGRETWRAGLALENDRPTSRWASWEEDKPAVVGSGYWAWQLGSAVGLWLLTWPCSWAGDGY